MSDEKRITQVAKVVGTVQKDKIVPMPEAKKLTAITFNLTAKQVEVLKAIMTNPVNKGVTDPNEACQILVIQCLVNAKQQMVAQELSQ